MLTHSTLAMIGHNQPFFSVESLVSIAKQKVIDKFLQQDWDRSKNEMLLLPHDLIEALKCTVNAHAYDSGNTLLHEATSLRSVVNLLALGSCPNSVNNRKETPLIRCVKRLELKQAYALLDYVEDLDIEALDIEGRSVVHYAYELGDSLLMQCLLKREAHLGIKFAYALSYSLHFLLCCIPGYYQDYHLCSRGLEAVFTKYMSHESSEEALNYLNGIYDICSPKIFKRYVNTPLSCLGATYLHYAKTPLEVKLLLGAGADYKSVTKYEENPLHYMIKLGNIDAARELLEHVSLSSECNHQDCNFMSPLCSALLLGDCSLVEKLLEKNAHLFYYFRNFSGKTLSVFHILATLKNNKPLIDLIYDAYIKQSNNSDSMQKPERFELLCLSLENDTSALVARLVPSSVTEDYDLYKNFANEFLVYCQKNKQMESYDKFVYMMQNNFQMP